MERVPAWVLIGKGMRKRFGRTFFAGTVRSYDASTRWFKVKYEDGDEEELAAEELAPLLVEDEEPALAAQRSPPSPPAASPAASPPLKAEQQVASTPPRAESRVRSAAAAGLDDATPVAKPVFKRQARAKGAATAKPAPKAVPGGAAKRLHVSQLDVSKLPTPHGPACVNYSATPLPATVDAQGVRTLELECFLHYLYYRACESAGTPLPVDYVQACVPFSAAYRHLCIPVREGGEMLRTALRPLVAKLGVNDASAEEALSCCLRAALIHMQVGRKATFISWRDWKCLQDGGRSEAAVAACPPLTDDDLESFIAFTELEKEKHDNGEQEAPFFTNAYQTRGFRLLELLDALKKQSLALAKELRGMSTWKAVVERVKDLKHVGPFMGGQAMCLVYHGVVCGDVPGGFFSQLLPNLDPASLMDYATPGNGPERTLEAIFPRVDGTLPEKLAWLAKNANALFTWLGLPFPWAAAAPGLDGAIIGLSAAPARCRPMTAPDVEYPGCNYARSVSVRDTLKGAIRYLAVALAACGGVKVRLPELQSWGSERDVATALRGILAALVAPAGTAIEFAGRGTAKAAALAAASNDDLATLAAKVCAAAAAAKAAGLDPSAAVAGGIKADELVMP